MIPAPSASNNHSWLGRTGPIGRTVDDIAFFMAATAGPDSLVQPPAPIVGADFAAVHPGARPGDLRGLRIGWSPDYGLGLPVEPEIVAVIRRLLPMLEQAGAIVEEVAPDLSDADQVFSVTRAVDFATTLGELVRTRPEIVKPEVIWNVELGWSYSSQDLIDAAAARTRLDTATRDFFTGYDLFLAPTTQVVPFDATWRYPEVIAGTPATTYLDWMRSVCLISAAGLPALSLPAGFTEAGLPVGVQLVSDHYRDVDLLRWAGAIEQLNPQMDVQPTFGPQRRG